MGTKFLPLFALIFFFGLSFALPISAQCPSEGLPGGFLFFPDPLVPCGMNNNCAGAEGRVPCTICHLMVLINNLYNLLLSLLIIVSLLMLTIGGVIYIISSGNSGLKSMAKSIITKTLTGFGIFLLSWLIVYTVLVFISARSTSLGSGGNWWQFECSTESLFYK